MTLLLIVYCILGVDGERNVVVEINGNRQVGSPVLVLVLSVCKEGYLALTYIFAPGGYVPCPLSGLHDAVRPPDSIALMACLELDKRGLAVLAGLGDGVLWPGYDWARMECAEVVQFRWSWEAS